MFDSNRHIRHHIFLYGKVPIELLNVRAETNILYENQ